LFLTDEPSLKLIDALLEQLESLGEVHVWPVPPIHRREGKVGTVAVGSVWGVTNCAVQVDPVQFRLLAGRVEPAEEEVDRVRLARPERVGKLEPSPRRCRGRAERDVVPTRESNAQAQLA